MREYRKKNPQKIKEIRRCYYIRHQDEIKAKSQKYREENREKVRERNRDYNRKRRDKKTKNLRSKKYYENNKEAILKRQKEYNKNNREKINAKALAENHVPLTNNCVVCGSVENLERHHPDYSKPKFVITMCKSCHNLIHSKHCPEAIRMAVRDLLKSEVWEKNRDDNETS